MVASPYHRWAKTDASSQCQEQSKQSGVWGVRPHAQGAFSESVQRGGPGSRDSTLAFPSARVPTGWPSASGAAPCAPPRARRRPPPPQPAGASGRRPAPTEAPGPGPPPCRLRAPGAGPDSGRPQARRVGANQQFASLARTALYLVRRDDGFPRPVAARPGRGGPSKPSRSRASSLALKRPPGLCHPPGISVFPSAGLEEKTIIRSLGRRQRGCGTGQWRPDGQGKGLGGRWGKRGPAVRLVPCLPSLPDGPAAVPTLHSRAPFIPHAFMGASGAPASVPGWLGTPRCRETRKDVVRERVSGLQAARELLGNRSWRPSLSQSGGASRGPHAVGGRKGVGLEGNSVCLQKLQVKGSLQRGWRDGTAGREGSCLPCTGLDPSSSPGWLSTWSLSTARNEA